MKHHYQVLDVPDGLKGNYSAFSVKGSRVPKMYTVKREPSGPVIGHIKMLGLRHYVTSVSGVRVRRLRDAVRDLVAAQ